MSDTPQLLLAHHLNALKLPTFLREYDKLAQQCAAEGVDHPRYLLRLAELELIDRERRMVERRIKEARFPTVKSLDSFDFTAIPSLNKTLVLELARCEYVTRRDNVYAYRKAREGASMPTRSQIEDWTGSESSGRPVPSASTRSGAM
jgi:DNA replication protein DnaC